MTGGGVSEVTKAAAKLWRRDPRPGVLVIVAGLAAVAFLGLLAAVVISPAFAALDERVSSAFNAIQSPALDLAFGAATYLGSFAVLAPLTLLVVIVLAMRGRRPEAVLFAATMSIGPLVGWGFKLLVERSRPGLDYVRIVLPDSYSFPSGHALASLLFFGLLSFLMLIEARTVRGRAWALAACSTAAVFVALSRVYLGVHWFGDIIASWILGIGILSAAVALFVVATADQPDPGGESTPSAG